jgi:hypothetical protein
MSGLDRSTKPRHGRLADPERTPTMMGGLSSMLEAGYPISTSRAVEHDEVLVDTSRSRTWPTLVMHPTMVLRLQNPGMTIWEALERWLNDEIDRRATRARIHLDHVTAREESMHEVRIMLRSGTHRIEHDLLSAVFYCTDDGCPLVFTEEAAYRTGTVA